MSIASLEEDTLFTNSGSYGAAAEMIWPPPKQSKLNLYDEELVNKCNSLNTSGSSWTKEVFHNVLDFNSDEDEGHADEEMSSHSQALTKEIPGDST